jgi:DNA polymerase type B, organellar and viral
MLITDKSLNNDKSEFIRTINDFSLHIKNEKIIKFKQNIVLDSIKYIDNSEDKFTRNTNIGTLDIETYYDKELDKSFTYAIGFKIFKGKTNLFYKKDNQTSEDLIIECINSLLVNALDGYTLYVHNLNGYDSYFILKALLDYNYKNNNYYRINTIFRDGRIIKLTISIKLTNNSYRKINLVDSYLILPSSLAKLAIDFYCEHTKSYFPYEFVNKSNLYYKGKTPNKKYYTKISDEEYKNIKSTD